MRKFWISYLISNIILTLLTLAILNNGKGSPAPIVLTISFLGTTIISLPAIVIGIWEPQTKPRARGFVIGRDGVSPSPYFLLANCWSAARQPSQN
jgi:hypothetical protein